MPAQQPALNFTGDGVSVADNPGASSTDVTITNAQVANLGGGEEVYRDRTGQDPVTVNLRTLVAGDASMVVSTAGDTIEFRSLGGGGGGEVNDSRNDGVGGVGVTLPKDVFDLPFKSIFSATTGMLGVADGGANNRVELSVLPGGIDHGAIANSGSNSHAAIDSHIGNSSIHFAASTLPGQGLTLNVSALDVGAGAGITVNPTNVAVNFSGDGLANTVARSDHNHITNQLGESALLDNAATNAKLADMAAGTIKLRQTTLGDPVDTRIDGLTQQASPGAATMLLAQETGSNTFVRVAADDISGGAGEENTQTNLGGGVEVGLPKNGVDLPLRTFISSDSSVDITPIGNTLNFQATGAGGGQANESTTPATVGANEADINMPKIGVDLQKRKLVGGTNILLTENTDSIVFATPADMMRSSVATELGVDVGIVGATQTHAQGTDLTPDLTKGSFIRVTGTGALNINAPAVASAGCHGTVYCPSTISPALGTGWTTKTKDSAPGPGANYLHMSTHDDGVGGIIAHATWLQTEAP